MDTFEEIVPEAFQYTRPTTPRPSSTRRERANAHFIDMPQHETIIQNIPDTPGIHRKLNQKMIWLIGLALISVGLIVYAGTMMRVEQ